MNLRRLLNLVLAVFVIAGLVMGPLVAPSAAAQTRAHDITEMSMSSDMLCCPEQKSMDCQNCPLMAICVLQTVQAGPPMAATLLLRYAVRTTHLMRDDALSAGLDRPPPDQPPRYLV